MTRSNDNAKLVIGYTRNYSYPDLLRQTENAQGLWKNLQFIDLDKVKIDKVDVLLVLNHPKEDIKLYVRKGGKLIIIQEPPYPENNYLKLLIRHFDCSISDFKDDNWKNNISTPAGLPWHVNRSYEDLILLESKSDKLDKVSWITSSLSTFSGHKIRLKFIDYLKTNNFEFDLYGRGFNPIDDKFDGIEPYKYSIAAENYISNDYFTEKILDVYLAGSMPMYYGCQNLDKYFPKGSYLELDFQKPEWSLGLIKEAVNGDFYSENKSAIMEARDLILNKYQLFKVVEETINEKMILSNQFELVKIRKDGLTSLEFIKKTLKSKFIRS